MTHIYITTVNRYISDEVENAGVSTTLKGAIQLGVEWINQKILDHDENNLLSLHLTVEKFSLNTPVYIERRFYMLQKNHKNIIITKEEPDYQFHFPEETDRHLFTN